MPIEFTPMQLEPTKTGKSIFVSASIPDPGRWSGDFDALEITDAVVSLARVFLTSGFHLVTAAHPTIAPLLMYVAAEFPADVGARVRIYQSSLFQDVLPTATRRFEADGVGSIVWTAAADGDAPEPGQWDRSLALMRQQMLTETEPIAAVFVGGMDGIPVEYRLFTEMFPGRPAYPVGRPGGEARGLVESLVSPLRTRLRDDGTYSALWRAVAAELERIA